MTDLLRAQSQALAAIVHLIHDPGGDPAPIVQFISDSIVDENPALSQYTCRELRFVPQPDGDRHYVPPVLVLPLSFTP